MALERAQLQFQGFFSEPLLACCSPSFSSANSPNSRFFLLNLRLLIWRGIQNIDISVSISSEIAVVWISKSIFFSVPPPEVLAFRSTPTAAWETIQLTDIHRPDRQVISLRGNPLVMNLGE